MIIMSQCHVVVLRMTRWHILWTTWDFVMYIVIMLDQALLLYPDSHVVVRGQLKNADVCRVSINQDLVPDSWKNANVAPIPKSNPPNSVEKDHG